MSKIQRAHVAGQTEEQRQRRRDREKRWRDANPERTRAKKARYRDKPGDARRAALRRAARTDDERAQNAAYMRDYRRKNRARLDALEEQRRNRLLARWVEDVDRGAVYERDGGLCGICGEAVDPGSFHIDRITPISKGGWHCYANVQLAHGSCNSRKGTREGFVL